MTWSLSAAGANDFLQASFAALTAKATELEQLGIHPVVDVPGVGENLQDHLEVYIQYASKQPVSMFSKFMVCPLGLVNLHVAR